MTGFPFRTCADLWNCSGLESKDLNWKLSKARCKSPHRGTQETKAHLGGRPWEHKGKNKALEVWSTDTEGLQLPLPLRNWPAWVQPDAESPVLASVRELLPEDAEINIDFWWLCGAWTNKNEDVRDLEHTTGHPLKTSARLGSCKEQLWDAQGCLWGSVYIGVPVPRWVGLRGIRNWW